jgi:hypothetical protein
MDQAKVFFEPFSTNFKYNESEASVNTPDNKLLRSDIHTTGSTCNG